MTKVLGVGGGVFAIGFFLVLCILICFAGTKTRFGSHVCLGSSALFFSVFLILLASPRGTNQLGNTETSDKDYTVLERVFMIITMCSGVLLALVGILVFHAEPPKYARPIDYRLDVLRA